MKDRLNLAAIKLKVFIDSFFNREEGAVDVVAIVVLIAVAVVLALVFKDQITGIVTSLLGGIDDKAQEALN